MFDQLTLSRMVRDDVERLCVALSGGVDSVVLLHSLLGAKLDKKITAIHINHGLQDEADEFTRFCESLCETWRVELQVGSVEVVREGSLEGNARAARYAAFEDKLDAGDLLLLAHHADDQVETALFRLFRGSRVPGMEGMPRERAIGQTRLFRPLLDKSRDEIVAYAEANNLNWMDDPTNKDEGPDRNYIRLSVLPKIEERFSNARQALLAKIERDALFLEKSRAQDMALMEELLVSEDCMDLPRLKELEVPQQESVIDTWLMNLELPLPGGRQLTELLNDVGEQSLFSFQGIELRKFKNRLYVLRELPSIVDLDGELVEGQIDVSGGRVSNSSVKGQGLKSGNDYRIKLRSGGEALRIRHNRSLKNLFQEEEVPSWLRDRIPLIFQEDQLVAVAALPGWDLPMLIADEWSAGEGEEGWQVELRLEDRLKGSG